ncbi:hypothetical protein NIES2101_40730, partial [Calothrix sp. HK-06]
LLVKYSVLYDTNFYALTLVFGAVVGWQAWLFFKRHLDNKLPQQMSSDNTLAGANSTSLPPSQNL